MPTEEVWHGIHLYELGRYAEARRVAAQLLASEPEDPTALRLLAHCQLNLNQTDEALKAANRLVAAEPGDGEGHRLASVALQRLHQRTEAHRAAASAVRLEPLDAANHVQLALTAQPLRGHRREARAAAARAVQLAPHDADAHFATGFTARRGTTRRAAYRRALALDPAHSGAGNNLQVARGRTVRLNSLVRGYLSVLEHDPSYETAQRNLVALTYRFVRRYYWSGVVLVLLGIGLSAEPRSDWWPAAPLVAVVALAVGTWYAAHTWRQLPVGPRHFLLAAWRSRTHLVATTLHTAALLVCALVLLTVPVPSVARVATLAVTPLIWLNLALFAWALVLRPRR
ncbi:hypothetical protein D9V37_13530 [Nocardioides mangrovicus]|uniref:Uncharacterized protein n=1 Tax=Nocardioides mangrovicus TaxID=2478913 RepID=A0A3L8P0U9_9ACTN|nr:tetratricopeptide repeat protein [Nocardioides mangrovicus]RLV48744.1 hypothetical protein D9V37_13530 [Nocardioides mangrovicus]